MFGGVVGATPGVPSDGVEVDGVGDPGDVIVDVPDGAATTPVGSEFPSRPEGTGVELAPELQLIRVVANNRIPPLKNSNSLTQLEIVRIILKYAPPPY